MKLTIGERLAKKSVRVGECLIWTGAKAGKQGYGVMRIDGKMQGTHRLAWIEANGPIPDGMLIDHVCHTPSCISLLHLRLATQKQNNENQSGAYRSSKSGVRGVCWGPRQSKWKAYARHNGKLYHAGYFDDLEEAGEAAKQLRLKLFTFNTVDLS